MDAHPRVRRARPQDALRIRNLVVASVHGLAGSHYGADELDAWTANRTPEDYRRAMHHEDMVVAEEDGRIVGFGSVEAGEIRSVYVHPRVAGRGVGALLLGELEAISRRQGAPGLLVYASLNGAPFYERAGFRRVRRLRLRLTNGAVLPAVKMFKDLQSAEARR